MISKLKLYSTDSNEILDFLDSFGVDSSEKRSSSYWEKSFSNPVAMADYIAAFVDNKQNYSNTNMWASIDSGVFINIKEDNYNYFIQYLYERFPY